MWDPMSRERELMAYMISANGYIPMTNADCQRVGRSLPWDAVYEGVHERWLRWFDGDRPLPTGAERAAAAAHLAEAETQRADAERRRADELAPLLLAHGIKPPTI